ncbi:hypothetical protein DPMN_010777 [Dreissena polymorpha]|uniref:PARP catalytic domain-containing protein n=1 Tax=Dreissena polymorpha TaxID=45954 RepID=A0A9D4N3S7_DREPO|nr:hypothetical protein DPMN_010777 [Dreissena polymorpha]
MAMIYVKSASKTDLGEGVYFTVNASDSCVDAYTLPGNGIKRVHYCAVLTGEFTNATSGKRVPPSKPTAGKNALYDSVTDDSSNPTTFVVFSDTQAYPLFIVNFK